MSLGKSSFSDSDLEAEADLPSLDSIIPKEQFKKLKPKEKKRQEVINGKNRAIRLATLALRCGYGLCRDKCSHPWLSSIAAIVPVSLMQFNQF